MNDLAATTNTTLCCASCGKAEVDDVKLKKCACKLVKYCSIECQKNHRPLHKKACKKRISEIRDDNLFTQPDGSHLGECPICCLPLSLDNNKSSMNACCGKVICNGCSHANARREIEGGMVQRCPFCREKRPNGEEEKIKLLMKRVKMNDPGALCQMGLRCQRDGNHERAFEYMTNAVELGHADAHYSLSLMYELVQGIEADKKKVMYHLEEAALGGHAKARYYLAIKEGANGRDDRAMKHYIIAAKLGYDDALESVTENFRRGFVSKEDYASALRGHQAAVDATKSEQRDAVEKAGRDWGRSI